MSKVSVCIHEGDALEILRSMPDNSYHGCLTDPPYGLSFMGHGWDHGVPSVDVWREVLRVLRPGAHVLAFGGTRTFHRLTCAIEDAGFEIRDCMQWLYGSGFPKSHDVSKAIDKANGDHRGKAGKPTSGNASMGGPNYERTPKGHPIAAAVQYSGYGTALKPAYEPIIVARKPLDGTVAENVQSHGCGALAIDASRIGYASDGDKAAAAAAAAAAAQRACQQNGGRGVYQAFANGGGPASIPGFLAKQDLGRWPANVILDGVEDPVLRLRDNVDQQVARVIRLYFCGMPDVRSGEVRASQVPEGWLSYFEPTGRVISGEAGAILDEQSGNRKSTLTGRADPAKAHGHPADPTKRRGSMFGNESAQASVYADSGGASRFFYCPKASRAERDAGLEAFDAGCTWAGSETRNIHPTVKPLALARYLARLILPPIPDARMITPFSGSGSEVIGALQAGWAHVDGIDSWDVAVRISRARIAHLTSSQV